METFKDGDFRGFLVLLHNDERCDNVLTTLTRVGKKQRLQEMIANGRAIAAAALATRAPKSGPCVLVYEAKGDKTGPGPRLVATYSCCTATTDGNGPTVSIARGGLSLLPRTISRILHGKPYDRLTPKEKRECTQAAYIGTGEGVLWKEVLWVKRCSREEFDRAEPDEELRKELWKKLQ